MKVVPLTSRREGIRQDTVEHLRDMLARAERGEVYAFAAVLVANDGSTQSVWTGSDHFQEIIGGLSILQHRMIVRQHEGT